MLFGILKLLPIFPLYYEGKTVFYPLHVTDMCEIIEKVIEKNLIGETIECIGPEKMSFKKVIESILKTLEIKRFLLPMPISLANIFATLFELIMKNPLITKDQLILLKHDNSPSGKYKTNIDLKLNSEFKYFDREIAKYSYMWKDGGEFAKSKI